MAERKRRGEDPADDHQDDALFDDAIEDDDLDDGGDDEDEPTRSTGRRGGGTATKARPKADGARPVKKDAQRVGLFGRFGRFVLEVVAELRKVIWPTRKELLTYTSVVVVFVAVMLAIVGLLDLGFAKAVLWVFGDPSKE